MVAEVVFFKFSCFQTYSAVAVVLVLFADVADSVGRGVQFEGHGWVPVTQILSPASSCSPPLTRPSYIVAPALLQVDSLPLALAMPYWLR